MISPAFYRHISDLYGAFEELQQQQNNYLEDAHTTVVLLDDEEAKLDLLRDFRDTSVLTAEKQPTESLRAVKAINGHVITRGRFSSLNEYLAEKEILVCEGWAFLSRLAGFEISPNYIRSGSCLGIETSEGGDSSSATIEQFDILDILALWPPF